MMIMIVKHQRNVDQHELVVNVKKDLVYLVNHHQESSLCVEEGSDIQTALDLRRQRERYNEYIDDAVT